MRLGLGPSNHPGRSLTPAGHGRPQPIQTKRNVDILAFRWSMVWAIKRPRHFQHRFVCCCAICSIKAPFAGQTDRGFYDTTALMERVKAKTKTTMSTGTARALVTINERRKCGCVNHTHAEVCNPLPSIANHLWYTDRCPCGNLDCPTLPDRFEAGQAARLGALAKYHIWPSMSPLPYSSCTPHYPIRSIRDNCFHGL